MAYHNPFIDKNGRIKFPDNTDLVRHVEKWAKVRGDQLAYRFLDFSTERDGVARDISWSEFGARNRAVGARLQQVTQPGDRVAILCPQSLDYLSAFFGTLYAGRIAVPLFDPAEPGHVGRLHAVLDDCTPSAILTTSASAEGVRKFFRSRPAKERPRIIAVDAVPNEVASTWEPILAGHAYIAPGDRHLLVVRDGARYQCRLSDGDLVNRHRPSVDVMFRSVAQSAGRNSVGVMLTGMGRDGAEGMKEMREAGAPTIAQDEKSSVVWGMPGAAWQIGAVQSLHPLPEIAGQIVKLAAAPDALRRKTQSA